MSSRVKHHFNDPAFFNKMKNIYLFRALEEVNRLKTLFFDNSNEIVFVQKELSITIISSLLRKAYDQELVDVSHLKNDLNTIIHSHMVFCLADGSIVVRSDDDVKYERKGVLVTYDYLIDLEKLINKWIKKEL